MQNFFKPDVIKNPTLQGAAGYDNPRENIDPHLRTQAVTSSQGTIQHTPSNDKDIANKKYVDDQDALIDHDALVNFDQLEHIDWSGQSTDYIGQDHFIVAESTTHYTSGGGRALDTEYTCSSDYAIFVWGSMRFEVDSAGDKATIKCETTTGNNRETIGISDYAGYATTVSRVEKQVMPFGFYVAAGATYKIVTNTAGNGTVVFGKWNETRMKNEV